MPEGPPMPEGLLIPEGLRGLVCLTDSGRFAWRGSSGLEDYWKAGNGPGWEDSMAGEVCLGTQSLQHFGKGSSLCSKGSSARAEPLGVEPNPWHQLPLTALGLCPSPLSLLQLLWDLFSLCSAGRAGSQEKAPVVCWVILRGLFIFYIQLLWFCSCFSLECLCALCFALLAGFAAQAMGAPCSAD